jgi:GDPmannose 4,6-dehydratase
MSKKALITGVSGQDGSYLAELLVEKGYEVHGFVRRVALEDPEHRLWRIRRLVDKIRLHPAELDSQSAVLETIRNVKPDECYHLAARSFVSYSFDDEFSTINSNINGALFVLSSLRQAAPDCRFYFAGSSEMFGNPSSFPQNESTCFNPRSPYGISKVAGLHLSRSYRAFYGLHACCGILYNHESPRRGFEFVTRKITHTVALIKMGLEKELRLGNLEAARDWGFAGDYVKAMWLMLQHDSPDDYVIATGKLHTVRELAALAFQVVGLNWEDHVVFDERFVRPTEAVPLTGDASKAAEKLGWRPEIGFEELITKMVENDMDLVKKGTVR